MPATTAAMALAYAMNLMQPVAPPAPPAPPRPAPPTLIVPSYARAPLVYTVDDEQRGQPPHRIDVHATAGGETIWRGTLRIAPSRSASYNQSKTEADAGPCPPSSRHDRQNRSSFNVSLYNALGGNGEPGYRTEISWMRHEVGRTCAATGARTVSLSQAFDVAPGQMTVVEGDAGLRVSFSRRD